MVFAGAFCDDICFDRKTDLSYGYFDAEIFIRKKAEDLHERERDIKAARGEILDRNGKVFGNKPDGMYNFL